MTELQAHGLPAPEGLLQGDTVIDIGAGIRPVNWFKPKRHICVEPYEAYAEMLYAGGYEVIHDEALPYLRGADLDGCCVYLLDVLEHMSKDIGRKVVQLLEASKAKQVVIYTPNGFMDQSHDAWGLGGEFWQTHRSGWVPDEFKGWRTQDYMAGHSFYAVRP